MSSSEPFRLTQAIVIANVAVMLLFQFASPDSQALIIWAGGLVPVRLTAALDGQGLMSVALASLVTHMFLHGGWLHLGLNMLVLLAMGRVLEPLFGARRFALLYMLSGIAGGLAEWAWTPMSSEPAVGASGAISGLIAAQAMLFGRSERGPLLQALGLGSVWLFIQLASGIALSGPGLRIAIAAHMGGFIAGLVLALPLAQGRIQR